MKFNPAFQILVAVNIKPGTRDSSLGRFSDVSWLCWKALCDKERFEPGILNYVVQVSIENPESQAFIQEVFARRASFLFLSIISSFIGFLL
jgi:hypothetical protein